MIKALYLICLFVLFSGCAKIEDNDFNENILDNQDSGFDPLDTEEINPNLDLDIGIMFNDSESNNNSEIHGGSPAPENWDECFQRLEGHPCDFSLIDQFGDEFTLYDNYGKVIVLSFIKMSSEDCIDVGSKVQMIQESYSDDNFLWVTILLQNETLNSPTEEDVKSWSEDHGIKTSPVLAGDPDLFIDPTGSYGYPITAWPTIVIIDRDMVFRRGLNGWSETLITQWIDELI